MPVILLGDVDRCVCCGAPVPEGTQVCNECLRQAEDATKKVIGAFEKAVEKAKGESEKKKGPEPGVDDRILKHLRLYHTGKENAVYSKELEQLFSLSGRTVRSKINQLRQDGNPICSNCRGYYYAANQDEVNRTVKWLNDLVTGVSNARTGLLYSPVLRNADKVKITIEVG